MNKEKLSAHLLQALLFLCGFYVSIVENTFYTVVMCVPYVSYEILHIYKHLCIESFWTRAQKYSEATKSCPMSTSFFFFFQLVFLLMTTALIQLHLS